MKMGTTASPWRYDAVFNIALPPVVVQLRCPLALRRFGGTERLEVSRRPLLDKFAAYFR